MLRKITKPEIIKMISSLDTRTNKFTEEEFDYIIDMGYAELVSVNSVFNNEEIVSMAEYYEAGELKISLDIEEDVSYIYDMYLTKEGLEDTRIYPHGIHKIRNENAIYKDANSVGRIHIDLDQVPVDDGLSQRLVSNAVVLYAYTPSHTSEDVYIDQPTYLSMRDAFGCALYNKLNDTERETQKRASLQRTATLIPNKYPADFRIDRNSDVLDEGRVYIQSVFKGLSV